MQLYFLERILNFIYWALVIIGDYKKPYFFSFVFFKTFFLFLLTLFLHQVTLVFHETS